MNAELGQVRGRCARSPSRDIREGELQLFQLAEQGQWGRHDGRNVAPDRRRTTRLISSWVQPESSTRAIVLCSEEPSRPTTTSRPRSRPNPWASVSIRDRRCALSPRLGLAAYAAAKISSSASSPARASSRTPRSPVCAYGRSTARRCCGCCCCCLRRFDCFA